MKLKKVLSVAMAVVMALSMTSVMPKEAKADNPVSQTWYTADPSPMAVGDTLYLFTSHDEDTLEQNKPTDDYLFYTMKNWKCFSTKDMVNWTDHGCIFGQATFSWGHTWCYRAWACQCVQGLDGRFYLYVPILRKALSSGTYKDNPVYDESKDAPGYGIGVAVADKPEGPYKDALGYPLIEGDWNDIDPTVYIDDGQPYLFYGQTLKYCLLNEDMISLKTQPTKFNVPNYTEGPWFTKHDNMYYFIWAGNGGAVSSAHKGGENLQYAYCSEPLGSYTYGGILQETTRGNSFTNHPGVCDFKGHSYLFYHTNELPAGQSYHRSVCCTEFQYNGDGTISNLDGANVVEMSETVEPLAELNPFEKVEAETIAWEEGVKTGWDNGWRPEQPELEPTEANDMYVYNMHEGDFIKVRNVDFGSEGAVKFTASVKDAKADADASIEVYIRDRSKEDTDDNYELIGTAKVDNTSSEWKDVSATLTKKITGVYDVMFVFRGAYDKPAYEQDEANKKKDTVAFVDAEDTGMFKFDSWKMEVEPKATPAPTAAPTTAVQATTAPAVQPSAAPIQASPAPAAEVSVAKVKSISVKRKGAGKVYVSWKKATGAKKYELYYTTDKKFKKGVKKITLKKTSTTVKKLKKGKVYFFKVRGFAGKVFGGYSAVKKAKA